MFHIIAPHSRPVGRYSGGDESGEDSLQFRRHDDLSFDGLSDVDEGGADLGQKAVESRHLLNQHRVHALCVYCGEEEKKKETAV